MIQKLAIWKTLAHKFWR